MATWNLQQGAPQNDSQLSAFLAQLPRSAQVLAPSGATVAVNPAWERLWGVSLADLATYNIREDPQLREIGVAEYLERAFAGEGVEIPRVAYVPPFGRFAGQPRFVRATASPIFDATGGVELVVLLHEDVTETVLAITELEQARELLEESQRSAHVGSWAWDLATGSLVWTEELYRIYGLEPGEFLDYPRFLTLVHPEDRPAVSESVERALRDGIPFAFDHRIIRPDGSERALHGRGRVLYDREGRPARLVGSGQDITDRLHADEVERTFAGVWEHAPVGISVHDASAGFICVRHNRRALDLVGDYARRMGSIVGVSLRELFDDDSSARVLAVFERVHQTGEPFAVDEFPAVLPPDPEPRWYQWSLTPVRQGAEVRWLISTAVEVTGLVRSRQERQALLDAAAEGIYGLDAAGNCRFINPAACRLLGYRAEECLGHNMHELVHHTRQDGKAYPIKECPIYRAFGEGRSVTSVEETLWRKDGSPLQTLCSVAPVIDAGGTITGAVISIHDIGDRIRDAAALRASEARFRNLVDATMVGVALGEADGQVHYANDAFLRIVGYDRTDLEAGGVNWVELTPPDWQEVSAQAIAEARELGASAPYEKVYVAKDGTRVPVLVVLVRAEVDAREQWIATVLDLRERKQLERLHEDFLAMVTHDVRSPLATVRAGIQFLQHRQEYRESIAEAMLASTDRIARLVDDLGDVIRLESGRLKLRPVRCDLVGLVRAEVAALEQRSEQPIRVEVPAGSVDGEWDVDRLAQVVQNLLSNARTHAPGSDIVVRIEAHDDAVHLVVSDDGPGIDPAHVPHLFERFYRTDAGVEGLGLGLYITRMLVEAHGGRIRVESEPGRGTTFTVTIPWTAPEVPVSR